MKCKLVFGAVGLALTQMVGAQTALFYQNDGVIQVPPMVAPNVDAVNFVNNNYFEINLDDVLGRPYYTANTLNYTNNAFMSGNEGFHFSLVVPSEETSLVDQWASTFYNIGYIGIGDQFLGGKLIIEATNIFNPGTISATADSFISFTGADVNLDRSVIQMDGFDDEDPGNNTFYGQFDGHWNVETNGVGNLGGWFSIGATPEYTIATRGGVIDTNYQMYLPNANVYVSEMEDDIGSNKLTRVVFLQNTNPAIQVNVYIPTVSNVDPDYDPIIVEWAWTNKSTFTGEETPNFLYLSDDLAEPRRDVALVPNGIAGNRFTYIPENYFFRRSGTPLIRGLTPEVPGNLPDFGFGDITNTYTAYQLLLAPTTVLTSDTAGQNATNMPGRITFTATNSLKMNLTRVSGPNSVEIYSPNNLENEGLEIASPLASFDIRNTNGFLAATNLLHPALPRPEGFITLWSSRWTNIVDDITNYYHVLFVDSRFAPTSPGRVQDLKLTATNLVVNDPLNVTRSFTFEGENLTIATNEPSARNTRGELNLLNYNIVWPTSTPRLVNLTNHGVISTFNAVYFGGNRRVPHYSTNYNEPYNSFVNTGEVYTEASLVWSRYFENRGLFKSFTGGFSLQGNTAIFADGTIDAMFGDVSLNTRSLLVTNTTINAGRSLSLIVTNTLDDGGTTSGNIWSVGDSYSSAPSMSLALPQKPATVNLLGTTITNVAYSRVDFRIYWDAEDRGAVSAGFFNNAAIGRLVLHGTDALSRFSFLPSGGGRAIYVDTLELRGTASAYDGVGRFPALNIPAGMKVYFSDAVDETGQPLAPIMDGANGGRLVWVPGFAGAFSSKFVVYPDGSTNRVNGALASRCDLDSDGDGIMNCNDATPVAAGSYPLEVRYDYPPATDGDGDPVTNPPPGEGLTRRLAYPATIYTSTAQTRTFGSASGSYSGLFHPAADVDQNNSGYVAIQTTGQRGYSGKVVMGKSTYPISGTFSVAGSATKTVARAGSTALTLEMKLNLDGGDQIVGTVKSDTWTANLIANRLVFHKFKAAPYDGMFTVVMPRDQASENSPSGYGHGTLKVSKIGKVVFNASLADGTKITQQSAISKDGLWPLYAAPYKGKGLVLGWVTVEANTAEGKVLWIKPATTGARYYPEGFTVESRALGSRYNVPQAARPIVPLSSGFGRLIVDGEFLTSPIETVVLLDGKNKVRSSYPQFRMEVIPGTGSFQGEILNPETGKLLPFQGAFSQEGNYGAGFSWTTNEFGRVYLVPVP